jgi:hypothetical protein
MGFLGGVQLIKLGVTNPGTGVIRRIVRGGEDQPIIRDYPDHPQTIMQADVTISQSKLVTYSATRFGTMLPGDWEQEE